MLRQGGSEETIEPDMGKTGKGATIERISAIVGARNVLLSDAEMAPYLTEWRDRYQGRAAMVVRPKTTDEVAGVLAIADRQRIPVVPQGGNTGLVGGQIPFAGNEIVLALGRMNRIRAVDAAGFTLTAEAGVVLARVQRAAEEVDRLFPLSLGAEGSCQIGGNLSTNAGGVGVLAYGSMRNLVLGLEVVLASGEVWNGLRALRKDNSGYDLKHLFIGAEGTLGVITAAVLKLFARPKSRATAFVGLASPAAALALFDRARERAGESLTAFELMPRIGLDFVLEHGAERHDPLADAFAWYVLIELSSGEATDRLAETLHSILDEAAEAGLVEDAALAASLAQRDRFWALRHGLSEAQKGEGGSIKHDVSVPIAAIPAFLEEASAAVKKAIPGCRPVPFGHMGDGNIHFNVSQPVGADKGGFLDRWEDVNALVHGIVAKYSGSISAEHGIGVMKRDLLPSVRSRLELDLMRRIKHAFDPHNILNPGKLL